MHPQAGGATPTQVETLILLTINHLRQRLVLTLQIDAVQAAAPRQGRSHFAVLADKRLQNLTYNYLCIINGGTCRQRQ
jgi:hypothetical protein